LTKHNPADIMDVMIADKHNQIKEQSPNVTTRALLSLSASSSAVTAGLFCEVIL